MIGRIFVMKQLCLTLASPLSSQEPEQAWQIFSCYLVIYDFRLYDGGTWKSFGKQQKGG